MKTLRIVVAVLALALFASAPALAVPDLVKEITADGGWRFAGPLDSDPSPDLIEALAFGGDATVYLVDTSPLFRETPGPVIVWPAGDPPWGAGGARWPDNADMETAPIGDLFYPLTAGFVRELKLAGTGADSLYVVKGSASKIEFSVSAKR